MLRVSMIHAAPVRRATSDEWAEFAPAIARRQIFERVKISECGATTFPDITASDPKRTGGTKTN